MCCGTASHHGCGHWGHHGGGHPHAGSCCCGTAHHGAAHHMGRCFPTKEEKLARMERYLESLQNETKAVEERIAELKEEV
jgi:hypothetical protein